jgi:nicotinamide riboside transporter PnuC
MNKDTLIWILVVVSFIGAFFNIRKKVVGFYYWIATDFVFAMMYLRDREFGMMVLFITYTLVNIWGVFVWRKNK